MAKVGSSQPSELSYAQIGKEFELKRWNESGIVQPSFDSLERSYSSYGSDTKNTDTPRSLDISYDSALRSTSSNTAGSSPISFSRNEYNIKKSVSKYGNMPSAAQTDLDGRNQMQQSIHRVQYPSVSGWSQNVPKASSSFPTPAKSWNNANEASFVNLQGTNRMDSAGDEYTRSDFGSEPMSPNCSLLRTLSGGGSAGHHPLHDPLQFVKVDANVLAADAKQTIDRLSQQKARIEDKQEDAPDWEAVGISV